LKVMPGWGTPKEPGFYSSLAAAHGLPVLDFMTAANLAGSRSDAFDYACTTFTKELGREQSPSFDAVLIDEAQDFPVSFFHLAYGSLRPPKRLIFAYDELQNLSGTALPSIGDLLGRDAARRPIHDLINRDGEPSRDIILKSCYRNTPWALALAHALGFRVYGGPPIQGFDDPTMWEDVGYRAVEGELTAGREVTLERDHASIPEFFPRLLTSNDAVVVRPFPHAKAQVDWVVAEISRNLAEDQLDPTDILVIYPHAPKVSEDAAPLIAALRAKGIQAHIAGVTRSRDEFVLEGSVAISGIYRAKGNEAPMVYVLDAHYCYHPAIYRRNVLFTAITRSRAWVRICGWGPAMQRLQAECDLVREHNYALKFRLPTSDELEEMRKIQRDRTAQEQDRFETAGAELARLLDEGYSIDDLPKALRERLLRWKSRQQRS